MNKHQRHKQRLRALGLCEHCGKPALPGLTYCDIRRENQFMARVGRGQVKAGHLDSDGELSALSNVMYRQYGFAWIDGCEADDLQVRRLNYATRSPRYRNAAVRLRRAGLIKKKES